MVKENLVVLGALQGAKVGVPWQAPCSGWYWAYTDPVVARPVNYGLRAWQAQLRQLERYGVYLPVVGGVGCGMVRLPLGWCGFLDVVNN